MRRPTAIAPTKDDARWRFEAWLVADGSVQTMPAPTPDDYDYEEEYIEEEIDLEEIVQPVDVPGLVGGRRPATNSTPELVVLAACVYEASPPRSRPRLCVVGDTSVFAPSVMLTGARTRADDGNPAIFGNAELFERLIEHLRR